MTMSDYLHRLNLTLSILFLLWLAYRLGFVDGETAWIERQLTKVWTHVDRTLYDDWEPERQRINEQAMEAWFSEPNDQPIPNDRSNR